MNDTLVNREPVGTAVPFSAGTVPPSTHLPNAACDCHVHVYADRFPVALGARLTPPDASASDYKLLQRRIGTTRTVLVTPSTYGTDNRCMLEGLHAMGTEARGVAVISGSESTSELRRLDELGVRGIRINLSLGTSTTVDMLVPLAHRIADLGWHLQPMPDDARQVERLVDWTGDAATLERVLVDNPQVLYGFHITS